MVHRVSEQQEKMVKTIIFNASLPQVQEYSTSVTDGTGEKNRVTFPTCLIDDPTLKYAELINEQPGDSCLSIAAQLR